MGKRTSRGPESGEKPRKRLKAVHEPPSYEEVHTARQLKQLLTPDPDPKKVRHGLQSFKVLLDGLSSDDDDNDARDQRRQLLYDYLDSTEPRDDGLATPVFLPGLMDMWSLGAQIGNDQIMSAAPVVLALLLRLLARDRDPGSAAVRHGLGIGRTLLQRRQQELIARNLSADRGKEFVISPTLRLLREVVCFDGGALAKPAFRARYLVFRSLARNMGIRHLGGGGATATTTSTTTVEAPPDKDHQQRQHASVRTNAVGLLLAALNFLHPEAKRELLLQRDLVAALPRSLRDDPPHLVVDILHTLRTRVLLDPELARDAKGRLLTAATLSRIASLYAYDDNRDDDDADRHETPAGTVRPIPVPDAAHEFLVLACTAPDAGVLRRQSGFYPRGAGRDDGPGGGGLEGVVAAPVQNTVLAEFAQGLRPWSSARQAELLAAVFAAAPELVADYFAKKASFTFEPKLSATWIGYAALLFSTAAAEVPAYFGYHDSKSSAAGYAPFPPPTSVVVDNILPPPATQKVLVRCLSQQKSGLVPFFATRLLVVALEKLAAALRLYRDAAASSHNSSNGSSWSEGARRLVDEFSQRCPSMRDIVNSYRAVPQGHLLHREAASRLVRLYYEVIPQVALVSKLDVSPHLAAAVKRLEEGGDQHQKEDRRDRQLRLSELAHLITVARYSPGMRWFAAQEGLSLSPFTTLLRLSVDTRQGFSLPPSSSSLPSSSDSVLRTLDSIAKEQQLIVPASAQSSLDPIVQSFRHLEEKRPEPVSEVWAFLDRCTGRCATRPIKYLEMIENLSEEAGAVQAPILNPLTMAILEQLPSAVEAGSKDTLALLAKFLARYISFSKKSGSEDVALLDAARHKIRDIFPVHLQAEFEGDEGDPCSTTEPEPPRKKQTSRPAPTARRSETGSSPETVTARARAKAQARSESLDRLFAGPAGLKLDNAALTRWPGKTVDELVDDGYAAALMALLASEHTSIRKEALTAVLKAAARIRASEHDEREPCWLLLSELAESARAAGIDHAPLPTPLVAFACHALPVLRNPLHGLYAKVNAFLARGPVWAPDRLPLVREIVQEAPSAATDASSSSSYYLGLGWLIAYLADGLRTPADLALFHKRRLFETLLSAAGNPYVRPAFKRSFLSLVYRATRIPGGSTTLTTRFGAVAWLEVQRASLLAAGIDDDDDEGGDNSDGWIYEALIGRLWETADRERLAEWSRGGITNASGIAAA